MALDNFIPKIWSGNLMKALDNVHVFASVANREYEGEIKGGGDTVKISQIGDIDVGTYTKNSTSITVQELQDAQTELKIDQSKYFAFKIDDVDKAQQKPKVMQEAMRKAAYALKDTQDSYIAGLYGDAGLSAYTTGTPADVTSANVEDVVLGVGEEMDSANIPRNNRFMVIPPWFVTKLVLAGLATKTDNNSLWNEGFIFSALGFDFLMSNNVSNAGSWANTKIIAGVKNESIALAEQIVSVEAYRPESSFSDAVKGLHVYGGKIIRPDMTCVLFADYTAES